MTEPVAKWGKLGYEPVRGLQDRIVSRWLRAQRKNMARVFAERGLFHLVERLQQIRKSRQGMVEKNLMFREMLDAYAKSVTASTPPAIGTTPPSGSETASVGEPGVGVVVVSDPR
jgi:hypothetical protein